MKKPIVVVSTACLLFSGAAAQQNSKEGYGVPLKGTIKVLLVFAEVTGVDPKPTANWQPGQLPVNAAEYFDVALPPSGNPEKRITQKLFEASFGQYVVLGDYLDHVVQATPNDLINWGSDFVLSHLDDLIANNQLAFGQGSSIVELDRFTTITDMPPSTALGLPKPLNTSNSKIDVLIIIWRNNPNIKEHSGRALLPGLGGGTAFGSFTGVDNASSFAGGSSNIITQDFLIQEFFHAMFGANNWHTGAGGGYHTFGWRTSPWGLPDFDTCNL